jgi:drug/metabolite transporter (DMT)-like permease
VQHPAVAIGVALASAGCYAVAAVLQQREASRDEADADAGGLTLFSRLLRRPRWWLAVSATVVGALLHLVALRFGPLTLVQPLGVSALVLALPLGAALAGRTVTRGEWAAAVAVALGLLGILSMAPHHVRPPLVSDASLGIAVGGCAVVVALLVLLGSRLPRPAGPVLRAAAAAVLFGMASAMARLLVAGSSTVVLAAATCAVAAVAGMVLIQTAYRDGGLGAPLATCTLVDPLSAAVLGIVLLGETVRVTPMDAMLGVIGLGLTVAGLTVLSRAAPQVRRPTPEPAV